MTLAVIGYQQPLSHNFIDSLAQSTDLVTDLRNFVGTTVPSSDSGNTGTVVYILGIGAAGDGGAGLFYWNAGSVAADDGVNTIQPMSVTGAGRWLRTTQATPPSLITATGAVLLTSVQRTVIWQPGTPAAATFTLPSSPFNGEPHAIKNKLSTSAYPLTVAANGGQTIDGEPYVVLANFNDVLRVEWWAAGSTWIVV